MCDRRLLRSAAHGDALCTSRSHQAAASKCELEAQQAVCSSLQDRLDTECRQVQLVQAELRRALGALKQREEEVNQLTAKLEVVAREKEEANAMQHAAHAAIAELEGQVDDFQRFSGRGQQYGTELRDELTMRKAAEAERDELRAQLKDQADDSLAVRSAQTDLQVTRAECGSLKLLHQDLIRRLDRANDMPSMPRRRSLRNVRHSWPGPTAREEAPTSPVANLRYQ